METLKQENCACKTESVKNRIVCEDLNEHHISLTLKILKNYDNADNLHIKPCKNFRMTIELNHRNSALDVKVYVFAQNQTSKHAHYPKGLTWKFTEIKAIKNDNHSSLIM